MYFKLPGKIFCKRLRLKPLSCIWEINQSMKYLQKGHTTDPTFTTKNTKRLWTISVFRFPCPHEAYSLVLSTQTPRQVWPRAQWKPGWPIVQVWPRLSKFPGYGQTDRSWSPSWRTASRELHKSSTKGASPKTWIMGGGSVQNKEFLDLCIQFLFLSILRVLNIFFERRSTHLKTQI